MKGLNTIAVIASSLTIGCPSNVDEHGQNLVGVQSTAPRRSESTAPMLEICEFLEKVPELRSGFRTRTMASTSFCPPETQTLVDGLNCFEIACKAERNECRSQANMDGCDGDEQEIPLAVEIENAVMVVLEDGTIANVSCLHNRQVPITQPGPAHTGDSELWHNPAAIISHPERREDGVFSQAVIELNGGHELTELQRQDYINGTCTYPRSVHMADVTSSSPNLAGGEYEIDGKLTRNVFGDRSGEVHVDQALFVDSAVKVLDALNAGRYWTEDPDTCSQPKYD